MADDFKFVDTVIRRHKAKREALISILQDIQEKYRYLPEPALRRTAEKLELSDIQVYGVATFFKAFSLTPRGKHAVTVCMGTACHVRGADAVLEALQRELRIRAGETTKDGEISLETVNCLGACALGPIIMVDEKYVGQMTPGKVKDALWECRRQAGQDGK